MATGLSLEQPQPSPEKRLDSGDNKGNNALAGVDRVALMRQFTPADPGVLDTSFPKLTISGWEKYMPGADGATKTGLDASIKPGSEQPATKEQRIGNSKQALESPDSTAKQKMEAMSSLYNDLDKTNGKVHLKLKDNGVERDFEINRQSVGKNVNLLQMRSADASGTTHPVLRCVERNGEIEQQRNKNGSKADFRGDWWAANAKDSSISKFSQGETPSKVVPKPEVKPEIKPEAKPETKPDPTATERVLPKVAPIPLPKPEFKPADQSVNPGQQQDFRPPKPHTTFKPGVDLKIEPDAQPVQKEGEPRKKHDDVIIPWRKDRTTPDNAVDKTNTGKTVEASDISSFYSRQKDKFSCAGIAAGMMVAKEQKGRPLTDAENYQMKQLTGTTSHGYRNTLEGLAGQLSSTGLHAKAYNYGMGNVGERAMQDLNRELDQGHSAVAKVINPHTGNPHYIFIAGRNSEGKYILGDPDRKNTQHFRPVSQQYLQSIMRRRDGFVAGY